MCGRNSNLRPIVSPINTLLLLTKKLACRCTGCGILRENIADNGGIRIAYKALQNALMRSSRSRVKLPGLDTYSAEQLFFISFGSMFCNKMTPEARTHYIRTDPHTVPRHRVNVALMNSAKFASAFSCRNDKKMNPTRKCVLW
uniref:Putative peptidase family m13 includes neprilysin n=1 Tax=Ixodes ricinus TaxID=34613 RepID=A0A0K8R3G7_IXORI